QGARAHRGRAGTLRGRQRASAAHLSRGAEEGGSGELAPSGGRALPHLDRRPAADRGSGRSHGTAAGRGAGLMRRALAALRLVAASRAHAHGMRTGYLELSEGIGGTVLATWKTTVPAPGVTPRVSSGCGTVGESAETSGSNVRAFSLRCDGGLGGRRVTVEGIGPVLTEAVVRVLRPHRTAPSPLLTTP